MIALIGHGLASPLGPADIAATALAAGLSRADRIAHAPVLGAGEDADLAVGHAVLDGNSDHGERCRRLLELAKAELGPASYDAVLLCTALADPLRWGPDGPPELPADERFPLGHAAPAAALLRADELITQRICRRVLLMAVDSLLDPASLAWLAAHDRLRGPETPDGVAPGEAAVCWLLGPADPASLAQIESRYRTPATERCASSDAARWFEAAEGIPSGRDWVDITGEPWRYRAWGSLSQQLQRHDIVVGSDGWGDLGAATALAAGSLAIAAGERPTVVWSMSEDGSAGLIILR